jgi:hypothetical protein
MKHINVCDRLIISQRLPLGHYERKAAREAVAAEYEHSDKIENQFWKNQSYANRWIKFDATITLCNTLCDMLHVRRLKYVKRNISGVFDHYMGGERTIYIVVLTPYSSGRLRQESCSVRVLLHELAHHVVRMEKGLIGRHNRDFLWVEELLFDAYISICK